MASKHESKTQEKTPKKQKMNNSMDESKNNTNTAGKQGSSKSNTRTKSYIAKAKASTSASDSHSQHSKPKPKTNINRSFVKNSKLNIKMNASRPEQCQTNAKSSKLPFDNELVLQNLIRAQIEYLFSDYHLTNDTYLLARMQDNPSHWLSIDELCHNQKIRCLTNKKERILQALCQSSYLQISADNERVRRPNFTLPKLKPNRDLRRTVFLYGIAPNKTEQDIRKLLSQFGHIKRMHFQNDNNNSIDDEAPNANVAQLIMKKKFLFPSRYSHSDRESDDAESVHSHSSYNTGGGKRYEDLYAHPIRNPNGDTQDFSHLKTCFVVFESQSQATKCVKARVRAVDGMRCIHKYDYNKVAKKYRTAQMKGEKLSFSPPPNGGYDQRGRSPSQNRHDQSGYNNRGYNRNFNRDNRNNREYHNHNYRERSHSQSSDGDRYPQRNDRYQQRDNRYNQRGNNNGYTMKRAQTPNFKPNNSGNGPSFYDVSIGRKNRQSDDSDNEPGQMKKKHGLGRRSDRNSHENDSENNSNANTPRVKYSNVTANNSAVQNNKRNRSAQSQPNPNQTHSQSQAQSVGNMSVNSDAQQPILYSLSSNSKHSNKSNAEQNGNKSVNIPKPSLPMQSKSAQPIRPNSAQPMPMPMPMQSLNINTNTQSMAKKQQRPRSNSVEITAPPLLHSKMYDERPMQPMQPMPDINALKQSLQSNPSHITRSKSAQHLQTQRPQLYNPIPTRSSNVPTTTRQTAMQQIPNQMAQDAAALRAAGYQHELVYLPMDDLNSIMDDPLIAYDLYFGTNDQSGQSSQHKATQQMQQYYPTNAQYQQRAQSQRQNTRSQLTQGSHTTNTGQYQRSNTAANTGQYQPTQRSQSAQMQSQPRAQMPYTQTQQTQRGYYGQTQQSNKGYSPGQTQQTYRTQMAAMAGAQGQPHRSQMAAMAGAQGQRPQTQYSNSGYNAGNAKVSANGAKSAPFGPVSADSNQRLQFKAQQWQLDKLKQYKKAMAAKAQQQSNSGVSGQGSANTKSATALSVLSSQSK